MRFPLALLLACMAASSADGEFTLPFIQDDYSLARAQALQQKLPIFVECWAPW
ncbi:MAG: hypothetical protein JO061_02780 [Acidobacteriaceae bacterium]|nr:hypothetical protein [Acidobacteriaceae bacterium]